TMSALDLVLSYLTQPFIQRAFVIGILVALLSSLLSVFIVLKNVSLIGDGLAHTAFGGLAVGYYVGFFPLWTAAGLVVLGSTSIQVARSFRETMVLSPVFGLTSVVVGLLVSLVLDVAPGATIVLSGLGILLGVVTARKIGEFVSRE